MTGANQFATSIGDEKASGAIGILGHARFKTGLAEKRGLLVSSRTGDRRVAFEQCVIDPGDLAAGGTDFGQTIRENAEARKDVVVPASFSISKTRVLEALLISIAWVFPPLSFHISQLSTVPKQSLPLSARRLASGTFSRIQRILVPEK